MHIESFLNIFNSIPSCMSTNVDVKKKYIKDFITHGVLPDEKLFNCDEKTIKAVRKYVLSTYVNNRKLNNTFHPSWERILNTDIFELLIEQLVHYFTTYGFNGKCDNKNVYVPIREMQIRNTVDIEELVFHRIGVYDDTVLFDMFVKFVNSDIGTKDRTLQDLKNIFDYFFEKGFIGNDFQCKNRELMFYIYSKIGFDNADPEVVLKYVVSEIQRRNSVSSVLVKSKRYMKTLGLCCKPYEDLMDIFYSVEPKRYAEIFNRYKPVFLTLKTNIADDKIKSFVNKISRYSKQYHKPLKKNIIINATELIRTDTDFLSKLEKELKKYNNVFRLFKLYDALNVRRYLYEEPELINPVYVIRNQGIYVDNKPFNLAGLDGELLDKACKLVLDSILDKLAHLRGKNVKVTPNLCYGLPYSEKTFIGNLPLGSYYTISPDKTYLTVGIHWYNSGRQRVDLDLSSISIEGNKIGWDGRLYDYDDDKNIVFSGDMTYAPKPHGATEMVLFQHGKLSGDYVLSNSFFNRFNVEIPADKPYKYTFFIGESSQIVRKSMIKKEDIIFEMPLFFEKNGTTTQSLGLLSLEDVPNVFYFINLNTSNSQSISSSENILNFIKYYKYFLKTKLTLDNILLALDCEFYTDDSLKEDIQIDYDLTVENIDRATIINMLLY